MEMTVEYKTKEVEEIIIAHQNTFIPPPQGYTWLAIIKYGGAQCVLLEIVKVQEVEIE